MPMPGLMPPKLAGWYVVGASSRSSRCRRPPSRSPRTRCGRPAAGRRSGPGPAVSAIGLPPPAPGRPVSRSRPVAGRVGPGSGSTPSSLDADEGADDRDDGRARRCRGRACRRPRRRPPPRLRRSPSDRAVRSSYSSYRRSYARRSRRRPGWRAGRTRPRARAAGGGSTCGSSRSAAISSRWRGMPPRTWRGAARSAGAVADRVRQGRAARPRRTASGR